MHQLGEIERPIARSGVESVRRGVEAIEKSLTKFASKGVIAEEHRPLVFSTKTPHSVCTFLVDGTVAGTWRYDKGEVRLAPFAPLAPAVLAEVEEEADRLAAIHA